MKFLLMLFMLCGYGFSALAAEKKIEIETTTDIPTRIHISYTVKTGIGLGELNEIVNISQKSDAHTFNISSNAQATGVFKVIKPGNIIRESKGMITDAGLQPSVYSDQRANNEPSLALFDWKNHTLTLRYEGKEIQETLAAGTLDRLSLSYSFIFSPSDRVEAGNMLDIHVTDGRSLQRIQYKVSKEKLNTPLGELETVVLTKQQAGDDKAQRKIWLAPRYHMVPVRIQSIEKDGLEVEKMVAELSLSYPENLNNRSCCKH
ncbi:MAG TPA: DUF3108 domain-containing protein [Nitrosomonas sp.]|nr:DUF3108 domain-containing protein [Nitrosomonas sp.]